MGPTDYTSPLPMQPSGRPWAPKRTPGKLMYIMSNSIFLDIFGCGLTKVLGDFWQYWGVPVTTQTRPGCTL